MKECGLTKSDSFLELEVTRGHLEDDCISGTTPKAQAVIRKAEKGTLFIDEAYQL